MRRDYSGPGKYFVTICTEQKTKWFGSGRFTILTVVFPGNADSTIVLSVQPGKCRVSENIFKIIYKTGIKLFDTVQNPSFFDHFKRQSDKT